MPNETPATIPVEQEQKGFATFKTLTAFDIYKDDINVILTKKLAYQVSSLAEAYHNFSELNIELAAIHHRLTNDSTLTESEIDELNRLFLQVWDQGKEYLDNIPMIIKSPDKQSDFYIFSDHSTLAMSNGIIGHKLLPSIISGDYHAYYNKGYKYKSHETWWNDLYSSAWDLDPTQRIKFTLKSYPSIEKIYSTLSIDITKDGNHSNFFIHFHNSGTVNTASYGQFNNKATTIPIEDKDSLVKLLEYFGVPPNDEEIDMLAAALPFNMREVVIKNTAIKDLSTVIIPGVNFEYSFLQ